MGLLEFVLPCVIAVLASLVSGFCSYLVAKKNCDASIGNVVESNRHDMERLVKQHEIDIENLKASHELELEKMEAEHRHALELAQHSAQQQATASVMSMMFKKAMEDPNVQGSLGRMVESMIPGTEGGPTPE